MARKNKDIPPRNILIIRFSALGDVCMTIPVVYGICRANPSTRFVYLTKKAVAGLFIGAPSNLTVEGIDLKKHYHGPAGAVRLILSLCRRYDIDAVADLHSVLRTRIMDIVARLRGIPVAVIDKQRRRREELTSRGAGHAAPLRPMTDRYADVFGRLGLVPAGGNISAPVPGRIDPSVAGGFIAPKQPGQCWIAVAPFAAHRGKIYPEEKMRRVVGELAARHDTQVILFGGGAAETEVLDGWTRAMPGVVSLAGKRCGFRVELAIIGQCDVMVSMDSANMHLASLMGTPVVSIWGATHLAAGFGGWRQDPANAVEAPLACRPCSVFGNKVCHRGTYECLSSIEPEQIVGKVTELLNKQKRAEAQRP